MDASLVISWALANGDDPARAGTAAEAELVAASRGGDAEAFGALVRLHQARVFRLAGRFFRHREDVEEAAQETFLAAWRRLSTYAAKAPFEHWLTRICLRCCYAQLARGRNRPAPLPAIDPAAPAADPAAAIDLERLLARLSVADRFVLLLLDGEGWSVKEIAERTGWSQTAVKVRAFRARRRVRAMVGMPDALEEAP